MFASISPAQYDRLYAQQHGEYSPECTTEQYEQVVAHMDHRLPTLEEAQADLEPAVQERADQELIVTTLMSMVEVDGVRTMLPRASRSWATVDVEPHAPPAPTMSEDDWDRLAVYRELDELDWAAADPFIRLKHYRRYSR